MCVLLEELFGSSAVSSTDSITAGFCSQKLWGLTFLALEPWAGGPGGRWDPLLLRGHFHSRIILPKFYLPYLSVGPVGSVSLPLLLEGHLSYSVGRDSCSLTEPSPQRTYR